MSIFTVHHGLTYRAKLRLSWLETFASDDMVAQKFEELGFKDVVVTGEGEERVAQGTWDGPDESVPLTDQHVESVEEVKAPKMAMEAERAPSGGIGEEGGFTGPISIDEDGKVGDEFPPVIKPSKYGGGIGGMPLPPNEEVDGG